MLIFSRCLSSSLARWLVVPAPPEPKLSLPGDARAQIDELPQRLGRHRRVHDQDVRNRRQPRDRRQILDRVVAEIRVQRRTDRDARGCDQDRVAVGRRLRCDPDPQIAPRAGAIVRHHLLAQLFGHFLRQHPAHHVARRTGRKGHDQAYRFDRVIRLPKRAHAKLQEAQSQREVKARICIDIIPSSSLQFTRMLWRISRAVHQRFLPRQARKIAP